MDLRLTTLLVLTAFAIYSTEAARGGGIRGGRVSRIRTGGSSSSRIRAYRGPSYSRGSWQTAAALGTLYGISSYKRRRIYRDHPDREPKICFNEVDLRNETFGYFICPEEGQDDDLDDCCGDDHAQHCCKGSNTGAIIGGIIGGIIILTAILVVIICVMKNRSRFSSKRTAVPAQSWSSQQTTPQYTSPTPTTEPPAYNHIYSTPYSSGYPETTDGQNPQNTTNLGFEGYADKPSSNPPPYSEKLQTAI